MLTTHSVVKSVPATEQANSKAVLVTLDVTSGGFDETDIANLLVITQDYMFCHDYH